MSDEGLAKSGEESVLPIQVVLDPEKYSKRVYALILEKCQEWGCSPSEAEARLLDEIAAKVA